MSSAPADWEAVLSAERHLQALLPSAVLVGGTAVALHARHRQSLDGDHVLSDLRDHFDDVLATLEAVAGWTTARIQRPVLILGQLDGIMTGVRQLRRSRPLETELVSGLRVPTLAEMARIKAWLLVTRNTVRDLLDLVVLLERLGLPGGLEALRSLDELYVQPNGASVRSELVERLAAASPGELASAGPEASADATLTTYRGLVAPWNDWAHVAATGRRWSERLAADLLGVAP